MGEFRYTDFFEGQIDSLKKSYQYRTFQTLKREEDSFPRVQTEVGEVTVWCSNDYMCMSQHPEVIKACRAAAKRGVGSGGTRNISGTTEEIVELEAAVAALHKTQSALVGTSGYVMNQAALGVMGRMLPDCLILSDQLNHSSIIQGIKAARCHKVIFRHNDIDHLAQLLKSEALDRPKIIVCESIYSMHGDVAPIEDIYILSREHNALLYVDEVHAVGMYGDSGGGICQEKGIKPDVVEANFSKGFGTFGGYIASTRSICDLIRSKAPEFIFTTSIPVPILSATAASLRECQKMTQDRKEAHKKAERIRNGLRNRGIPVREGLRHIIPVEIGETRLCTQFCNALLRNEKIYLQPINYPSVPKGEERVRIAVTRFHTDEMISSFLDSFTRVWQRIIHKPSQRAK